ncbi:sulfurtransferase complex subunit TusD [Buchnera aphidicola]|uniref:Sulfurtransferase TusD n=1 Tax=Buchnera aphidicola (Cinara cf. splendens/pseudotsugae 3390) TaxID=2518980 RepID=A0A451CXT5_9GAMM|nr:sulfurtransferase complex subunit TusD [Buchnera aphidicola]VFP77928.1 Sulfurtransferase TusD [Buchnera aphidicola (Cinara cf. splendens/pseudotsugae 3390)]
MNYIVIVTGPPYDTQNSISAFLFSKSVLELNFSVSKIFFYASGVYNSNSMINLPSNEFNVLNGWISLKKTYNIQLCICPSSACRRGILSNESTKKIKNYQKIFSSFFKCVTLMELSFSIHTCDRIVQF